MFVLSTLSIRVGSVVIYYRGIFCLFYYTCNHGNICLCTSLLFDFGASALLFSFLSLNLYFSLLPSFQFLFRMIALLCHCLIVLQLRNLSIGLGEEPCIGFTQENSMENSLQDLSLLIYVVTLVHAMTMLLLP